MDVPKTSLLQSQIESESASLLEQQATERVCGGAAAVGVVLGTPDQEPAKLEDVFARPLPELDFATRFDERILYETAQNWRSCISRSIGHGGPCSGHRRGECRT